MMRGIEGIGYRAAMPVESRRRSGPGTAVNDVLPGEPMPKAAALPGGALRLAGAALQGTATLHGGVSRLATAALAVKAVRVALLLGGPLLLASCNPGPMDPAVHDPDPTEPSVQDPDPDALKEIRMRVTAGPAGVDFTVVLTGRTGALWGERCERGCSFQAGEVLQVLRPQQVWYISSLFLEAGIHRMNDVDFGPGCYGELHVDLIYRYEGGEGSVRGCTTTLPMALQAAVNALQGVVDGRLPVVVDFDTQSHLWPQDPFTVQEVSVVAGFLRVKVRYGGGCERHEFQGVAWGGWMESAPVQVRVFLSHDAFGDQCRALITEERYFDLEPLKRAYRRSYGTGPPGATTLVIHVENHSGEGSPLQRSVDYRF